MPLPAVRHADLANAIRALALDAAESAGSGHHGMPMGMADVATVLFARHLKYDPRHPDWPDRDRFVLSTGHGAMLLYGLLHLTGYPDMTLDELRRFRRLGARTAGHPELGHAFGVETTTGPLGQGLANAVGMALAERHLAARYGSDLVDHRTYVLAGDGDLMQGISHEAVSLAGHLRLDRLVVLLDDNGISIDGATPLAAADDQVRRFEAAGWRAAAVDGHDPDAVDAALAAARESDRPSLIACRTVVGDGASKKAGTAAAHGSLPGAAAGIEGARAALGWPHPPFAIPDGVLGAWRAHGARGGAAYAAWRERHDALPEAARADFDGTIAGVLPAGLGEGVVGLKRRLSAERPRWATHEASQATIETLTAAVPAMVGGSADLTGASGTDAAATPPMRPGDHAGRHVRYGAREHAMLAAMTGMAAHGGIVPYGGTFLALADLGRPALRLAAIMRQRVILVATHDSIGLGEDGPAHQPVEQLASLRAMPNLLVLRPADAVETAECWEIALRHEHGPSVLALTRQELATVRGRHTDENLCARGAYVLAAAEEPRDATILATGSEVRQALAARALLAAEGIAAAVVSMPSWELFERQDPAYRAGVLGAAPRAAVEAAAPFGWTRYVAREDDVVGMTSFGASGPCTQLYEHFGLTAERVAARVRGLLGRGRSPS